MNVTRDELQAGLKTMKATMDAIREAGSIPAGQLYAVMCGHVTKSGFDSMMRLLLGTSLIRQQGDLLIWVGE